MEQWLVRPLLESFWASGRDLREGHQQGWLTQATLVELPLDAAWRKLEALPFRDGCQFLEYTPRTILPLVERYTEIPDFADFVSSVLAGAEMGIRGVFKALGRPAPADPKFSAACLWTRWTAHWTVRWRSDERPPVGGAAALFLHHGHPSLPYSPFKESASILWWAIWEGLLWPAEPDFAEARLFSRNQPFYGGAAWSGGVIITRLISLLAVATALKATPWDLMDRQISVLPASSQIRTLLEGVRDNHHQSVPWEATRDTICRYSHYYPFDHIAPNLALIIAALGEDPGDWDGLARRLAQAGFDPIGNSIVAGALANVVWPNPMASLRDNAAIHALAQSIISHVRH